MAEVSATDADFHKNRDYLVSVLGSAKDGPAATFARKVELVAAATQLSFKDVMTGFKDGAGRCCLHFAATGGHTDVATHILEVAPACLDAAADDGATPLHIAVIGHQVEVVSLLLDRGANVNAAMQDGATPLHLAAQHDFPDVVEVLLAAGADAAREDASHSLGTPLFCAAAYGSRRSLQVLLPATRDVNAKAGMGMPALVVAAAKGFPKCAGDLCAAGADVAVTGPVGMTALHFAADAGSLPVCKAVVGGTNGAAAARKRNDDGLLPVQLAAGNDHRDVVDLLFPLSALGAAGTKDSLYATEQARVKAEGEAAAAGGAGAGAGAGGDAGETPLPPAATPEDVAAGNAKKAEGNAAFGAGRYAEALELYTAAVKLDPRNHAAWSNQSACFMKLERYEDALASAVMCRRLKPEWPKAYFREGRALLSLKRYEDAAVQAYSGMQHGADSSDLKELFETAIRLGKKHHRKTGRTQGV